MTTPIKPGLFERARTAIKGAATAAFAYIRSVEHTDWAYFGGLLLIHNGVWSKIDIGTANIITGVILVTTPLMLIRSQPAKKV